VSGIEVVCSNPSLAELPFLARPLTAASPHDCLLDHVISSTCYHITIITWLLLLLLLLLET